MRDKGVLLQHSPSHLPCGLNKYLKGTRPYFEPELKYIGFVPQTYTYTRNHLKVTLGVVNYFVLLVLIISN